MSATWPASAKFVLWIGFQLLGGRPTRLAVGLGSDDLPQHSLLIPAAADEVLGEPVEEFRMGWGTSARAKIFRSSNQAAAPGELSHAIGGDARGQRC